MSESISKIPIVSIDPDELAEKFAEVRQVTSLEVQPLPESQAAILTLWMYRFGEPDNYSLQFALSANGASQLSHALSKAVDQILNREDPE